MVPKHVAIIMDGNGRWAKRMGRPRLFGHIRGANQVRPIVRECGKLGIQYLTLYAFSSENWGRPKDEIQLLMRLLYKYLQREQKTLMKENVKLSTIGDIQSLPSQARQMLQETISMTSQNTGLHLIFALSYGSRQEILRAIKNLAEDVQKEQLTPAQITEDLFRSKLYTADIPDPDLIIRSSGECRLSNFLLWQSAYSEIYVTDKFWPEFTLEELHKSLLSYSRRKRRFGLIDEQLERPSLL